MRSWFLTASALSCSRWVDFPLRFDRKDTFRFAARQSPSGAAFSREAGLPEAGVGSIILVEGKTIRLRSEAVLRMLQLLGLPFSLADIFRVIPVFASRRSLRHDCAQPHPVVRENVDLPNADAVAERHRFI